MVDRHTRLMGGRRRVVVGGPVYLPFRVFMCTPRDAIPCTDVLAPETLRMGSAVSLR